jgi:DNA-binding transcriptional regulator YiaG
MKEESKPNYKQIYIDLIDIKHPEKKEACSYFLSKNDLSVMDIIEMSRILFNHDSKDSFAFNQKHRSYDDEAIMHILKYQEKNKLSNNQVAQHFNLSRNTVAKWKKQAAIPDLN